MRRARARRTAAGAAHAGMACAQPQVSSTRFLLMRRTALTGRALLLRHQRTRACARQTGSATAAPSTRSPTPSSSRAPTPDSALPAAPSKPRTSQPVRSEEEGEKRIVSAAISSCFVACGTEGGSAGAIAGCGKLVQDLDALQHKPEEGGEEEAEEERMMVVLMEGRGLGSWVHHMAGELALSYAMPATILRYLLQTCTVLNYGITYAHMRYSPTVPPTYVLRDARY